MAVVKPFRALRYDERRAGPLADLVAPPYDVISPAERERYAARSPYNVVHLTLPVDESGAARTLAEWEREGVLARDEQSSLWWLAQDYTGPDGVARRRDGFVAALRVEPYETGVIRPHERTHAGPKEGRLRLLRALRTHVEPIFLLYQGSLAGPPEGDPAIEVELDSVRSRLWRVEGEPPRDLVDASLLIADGHHRYETALAFHQENGAEESAWLLAVIVPTEQEGLTIFPTHRIALRTTALPELQAGPSNGLPFAEVYTRAGRVQDIGSQSIVPLLHLAPGQSYLDLCAAPGNKTAQALESGVEAIACDFHLHRAAQFRKLGIPAVVLDGTQPLPFGRRFDRVTFSRE